MTLERSGQIGGRSGAVAGDYAYLTYRTERQWGLRIVDVSDPANPREVGDYQDYVCCVSGVTVVERAYAYVAGGVNLGLRDLWVMDVSEAAQSFRVGVYGAPESIKDAATVGNRVYVAAETAGLLVVDVSDPAQPRQLGRLGFEDLPAYDGYMTVVGERAYIIGEGRLHLDDVSDPAAPREVLAYDVGVRVSGVAAAGDFVCLAGGANG